MEKFGWIYCWYDFLKYTPSTLSSHPSGPTTLMFSVSVLSYYDSMCEIGRIIGLVLEETNLTMLHKEICGFKLQWRLKKQRMACKYSYESATEYECYETESIEVLKHGG